MTIGLYFDAHVDHAIVAQLRLRQVDILTAQEDNADQLADDLLLQRASQLGRPIVTHDIRFKALAENWQMQGRAFCGLIFGHPLQVSIGKFVSDLESSPKRRNRKIGRALWFACHCEVEPKDAILEVGIPFSSVFHPWLKE